MRNFILIISLLFMPYGFAEELAQAPSQQMQVQSPVQTKIVQPQSQTQTQSEPQAQVQPVNPLVVAQNINYENCTKIFNIAQEKLFYLTLVALSANKFNIDEMQSSNGYIIFSANHNKYLATIAGIDNKNAILKITPCNNIYKFPPGIITNTFKYIDLNLTTKI